MSAPKPPTAEQEAIIDAFQTGDDLVVEAGAGCLAPDTVLNLNRGGKGYPSSIEWVVRQAAGQPRSGKVWDPDVPTLIARADDGVVRLGSMVRAWFSGQQETYRLTTVTGRTIRATGAHPFLTAEGVFAPRVALVGGGLVAIADDFFEPKNLDRAELMLAYVAVTRAKSVLDVGSLRWTDAWIRTNTVNRRQLEAFA